jgi:hypothetical protein
VMPSQDPREPLVLPRAEAFIYRFSLQLIGLVFLGLSLVSAIAVITVMAALIHFPGLTHC